MSFDPGAPGLPGHAYGLPHSVDEARVVLVPVPFEATTSYGGGAAEGPARGARGLGARWTCSTSSTSVVPTWSHGIAMLPEESAGCAAGTRRRSGSRRRSSRPAARRRGRGAARAGGQGRRLRRASSTRWLERTVAASSPTGSWWRRWAATTVASTAQSPRTRTRTRAWASSTWTPTPTSAMPTRASPGRHASIFHNVCDPLPEVSRLVQVGLRDVSAGRAPAGRGVRRAGGHPPRAGAASGAGSTASRGRGRWTGSSPPCPEHVYLSFDIDGLDPTLCPHTGTPVPGGPLLPRGHRARRRCGALRAPHRGDGPDEVAPGPEGDEWDGNVGARLLYKMIGWALRSQRGGEGR